MGRGNGADVEKVDRHETNRAPKGDFPDYDDHEKRRQRYEEEDDVPDETRLVDGDLTGADENTDDSDHHARHEERAAEDDVQSDVSVAGPGEGDYAGEHVGGAVSERKQGDSGDGRRQFQNSRQILQRRAEVISSCITQKIEQYGQP